MVGWEDAAVDPMRLGDYLREFQALVDRIGYRTSLYGHFGDGCIHARIDFELRTPEGLAQWRRFLPEAAHLVVKYGGSLSGEHGDGQAKAEFLPIMYGPELMQAFREFKSIWDPLNRMNPDKLIDPRRADEDLRLGPHYKPVTLADALHLRQRRGRRLHARHGALHRHGQVPLRRRRHHVPELPRDARGALLDARPRPPAQRDAARRGHHRRLAERGGEGGARLVPCLQGLPQRLPDAHRHGRLQGRVPVALLRERRPRPLAAQLMGRIGEWAPLARPVFLGSQWSLVGRSSLASRLQRSLPKFRKTFRSTFASGGQQGERVVLFDDTFNNHFRPQTARAAQKLLEAAGCAVELPREHLCCGRPYYDYGMLDRAKRALERVLEVLEPGVPVVMLEPGCLSVFRDELKQLFPKDARAARLEVFSLSEFLLRRNFKAENNSSVLVHSHCHQKAIWGTKSDLELLRAAGCEVKAPETGCCGMSGSFGYKPQHYEASKRIAGLALLPALAAAPAAEVVACGFSCREQIEDLGGRPTLHLAELLAPE